MHDATSTLLLWDAAIAGWCELDAARISADGCQRERWTFQRPTSAFLVIELTSSVAETRPHRRHRTWEVTTTWPRRAGGPPLKRPSSAITSMVDPAYRRAANGVTLIT